MPLNQQGGQLIGSDLQQSLVPSASYATGTYHIGIVPVPGNAQAFGLKTGASALPDILLSGGKYLQLILDLTVVGGAGTVTATIQGFDPASGKFYSILASAALAAVATTVIRVGPSLTTAANTVANDFMPLTWSLQLVVAGNAVTFTVGANQMP